MIHSPSSGKDSFSKSAKQIPTRDVNVSADVGEGDKAGEVASIEHVKAFDTAFFEVEIKLFLTLLVKLTSSVESALSLFGGVLTEKF